MYQQFSIPASSIDDIGTAVKPFGIDYKPERKDYVWKIEDTNPNTRDAKAAGWLGMYISRELSIYVFIMDTISFLFGDKRGGSRGGRPTGSGIDEMYGSRSAWRSICRFRVRSL